MMTLTVFILLVIICNYGCISSPSSGLPLMHYLPGCEPWSGGMQGFYCPMNPYGFHRGGGGYRISSRRLVRSRQAVATTRLISTRPGTSYGMTRLPGLVQSEMHISFGPPALTAMPPVISAPPSIPISAPYFPGPYGPYNPYGNGPLHPHLSGYPIIPSPSIPPPPSFPLSLHYTSAPIPFQPLMTTPQPLHHGKNCGSEIKLTKKKSSAIITSPNFPSRYPKHAKCVNKITAPKGKMIEISFLSMDVENHSSCRYDYVLLLNGNDKKKPIAKVCGTKKGKYITHESTATIVFKSDYSVQRQGFKAKVKLI